MKLDLDFDFYLAVQDLGSLGHIFCETSIPTTTREGMVEFLMNGAPDGIVEVVQFNPVEGHSSIVSEDIAIDWWKAIEPTTERFYDVPEFIKAHHPEDIEEHFQILEAAE